jgi:hypothetical protein
MFATVELAELVCYRRSNEDDSRPYLWVELLQIEDDGIVPIFPMDPDAYQLLIADGMNVGDSALIPGALEHLAAYFKRGLTTRHLVLVAALWNAKDTPSSAVSAGYGAFVTTVPIEVLSNLSSLQSSDPAVVEQGVAKVTDQVETKVKQAISDHLSTLDKIEIKSGLESPDRIIGTGFKHWNLLSPAVSGFFDLEFKSTSNDDFKVSGNLLVAASACEDQFIAVDAIRDHIAVINGALHQLGTTHGELTAEQEKELDQLVKERTAEQAKLKSAEDALKACFARIAEIQGIMNSVRAGRVGLRSP